MNPDTAPKVLQVVDEGGDMIDRSPWFDNEPELGAECYAAVACLGGAASGKSTLLNRLFGTAFAVAPAGRAARLGRTATRGIWVSQAAGRETLLVMDVEGGDGRDGGGRLAQLAARFVASVADVIILNVWYHDLGRYDTVPMAQLRAVLAESARGEGPLLRTGVVVAVHDTDPDAMDSADTVRAQILEDAEEMWAALGNKSAEAASLRVSDVFDFKAVMLPHIRHAADEFDAAVRSCSRRLLEGDEWMAPEFSKGLPADGFAAFSKRLWDGIKSSATRFSGGGGGADALSLSAPGASALDEEVLAAFKCDEVFSELLRNSAEEMADMASQIEEGERVSGFGRRAEELMSKYLNAYDDATPSFAQYATQQRKRTELESVLDTSLQSLFLKQLQLIRENALQHFKTASSSEEVPGDFAFYTADALFQREADDSVRPGSDWSYTNERSDLQQTMAEISARRKQLIHAQIQAAEQQRQAMQYMQLQQAQLQAVQQQQYGGALGNWNIGAAYRPPDTNVNMSLMYQQGRTQLQVSMVPDEQAGLLGPNGFTSGVGPGNLGLSFNVNL
ncbi:hypothetical protein CDCA_CDCA01G0213 [Cyanidium caldarium]|uniref:Sey1/RHD3-like three-helix bundle domain-containing protein n=1 Tax=Cyanidium caldarium TaxID=2771 RepID=A0AAV9IQ91_CYACA|nr:hypothetical protein CDCA_CDCA01G0213 [Cyanidium caldarium]